MDNKPSFFPLFFTNFFGVVNDNFLKTLASFIVIGWIEDPRLKPVFMGITAGALVLPYILFSPLADRLTVLFRKQTILRLAKWAELPIMAIAILGFALHSAWIVVLSVFLMGLQSSLYSPAKYALVRDVGGTARISTGMGGMEGIAFLGVLAGTILASFSVDHAPVSVQYIGLITFAILGLIGSLTIRAKEEKNRAIHSIRPLRYLRRVHRMAKRYAGLNAIVYTLGIFWWAAAMLQMGLLVYGKEVMGLNATQTGILLCAAAIGIVAGQIIGGLIDKNHFLLGASLFTGGGTAFLTAILYFIPMPPLAFAIILGTLAFVFGLFKLPLDAEIQKRVKGPRLNTILSYFNQVTFLFMLGASATYALVSWLFGPSAFFLVIAVTLLLTTGLFVLHDKKVMLFTAKMIFARRYQVHVTGLESIDPDKTYLVLPNHPAMVDPMLVATTLWRLPLKPLSDESFFKAGIIAPTVLKTLDAVAVPDLRAHRTKAGATIARGLTDLVLNALTRGGSVIFYPAGHIHTEKDHEEIGTRQLAYNICRALPENVEVIGVRTHGLWGSIWSRAGRTDSPPFVPTLIKSILHWFFTTPFRPRRKVTMKIENLTSRVRDWAQNPRLFFNQQLETWYNQPTDKKEPEAGGTHTPGETSTKGF